MGVLLLEGSATESVVEFVPVAALLCILGLGGRADVSASRCAISSSVKPEQAVRRVIGDNSA